MDHHVTRVLLVEDDADLGAALTEYLELSGLTVDWAQSGLEFYRLLSQESGYQVCVIDIGLPDQSGLVLGEYMRHNSLASVIILTANESPEIIAQSYNLGIDLFIGKPVDNNVLVSAIASMAQRSRQRMAAGERPSGSKQVSAETPSASNSEPASQQPWRLDPQRRLLLSPLGEVVNLGRQETKVLQLFVGHPEQSASRIDQLRAAFEREDDSAKRALDTLMSRLRRKITEVTGLEAPIITDYGVGHSFIEPLKMM